MEERLLNDILEDICVCKKHNTNRCNFVNNRLIHADLASIQRTLEKLGYVVYIRESKIEIRW